LFLNTENMRYKKKEFPNKENEILSYKGMETFHPVIPKLLAARAVEPANLQTYLHPAKKDLYDPYLFSNMQTVVARIQKAKEAGEQIVIYGDYDCDGVSGVALLKELMNLLEITATAYIPDRKKEGYGTNKAAFSDLIEAGNALIVTVDCGIRSIEDVAYAKEQGVDVIILDHHECDETLPDTPYILNPKRSGETYPFRELCGAGIAFKLMQAMIGEAAFSFIDVAAIATIGDMVPLMDENRVIAALGIRKLRQKTSVGITALAEAAGLSLAKITAGQISFGMVPRINAAGRLAHAKTATSLLLTKEQKEAEVYAKELQTLNTKRQALQKKMTEEAIRKVEEEIDLLHTYIIMVSGEGWDKGVVGLVASALANKYFRPAVVFAEENGEMTGSARSIPGVDLYEILCAAEEMYLRFGGHEMAAGLTIKSEVFPRLQETLAAYVNEKYTEEVFLPTIYYDETLQAEEIDFSLLEQLQLLEPFGQGNKEPVFYVKDYQVKQIYELSKGAHLKLNNGVIDALYFHAPSAPVLEANYDMVAELSINEYRGRKTPQMIIRNLKEKTFVQAERKTLLAPIYMRGFKQEMLAYHAYLKNRQQAREITEKTCLSEQLKKHFMRHYFGTAVFIGSFAGMDMIRDFATYENVLQENVFSAHSLENLICYTAPKKDVNGYRDIYLVGCFAGLAYAREAHIYMGEDLQKQYRETAKHFFVEASLLVRYEKVLLAKGEKGHPSIRALLHACAEEMEENIEKIWFALQVLTERKLLQLKKNDKIYVIPNEPTQEIESILYKTVEEICAREV
jgi:single-stranded-DNA-specific exonuclease RecJ